MVVGPVITSLVAFASAPNASTPVYTDVSSRLLRFETSRGKLFELDAVDPGSATIEFDNRDGAFNGWNTSSPYYGNLLTASQSIFHTGWAPQSGGNCTVTLGSMTSVASGQMSAETPRGTSGILVNGGRTYAVFAQFESSGTGRVVGVGVTWFDSTGTLINGATSPTVFDGSGSYVQTPTWTVTAPGNAVYANMITYVTTGSAGEAHLLAALSFRAGTSTTWVSGVGGTGGQIQPMRKLQLKADWNLLNASQSIFHTGWAPQSGGNCTVTLGTMTSVASGQMSAETPRGTSGLPVVGGQTYSVFGQFESSGTGRVVGVGVTWFDSTGTLINGATSPTVFDGSGSYVQTPTWNPVAPAGATYANMVAYVTTGSVSEAHFLKSMGMFPASGITTWSTGGSGYLITGFVESWRQSWNGPTFATTVVKVVDGFTLLNRKNIATTAHFDAQMADSPVALYRFDESGTAATNAVVTAVDSSGHGRDAVYKESLTYQVNGALAAETSKSVDLGERAGWIEAPITTCPSGTGDFTIEALVNPRSVQQSTPVDRIWHVTGVGGQIASFSIQSNGTLSFVVSDGTNGGTLASNTALDLRRWNHVRAVKSGTTGPGNWKLYLDDVDISGTPSTTGTGNVNMTANTVLWGGFEVSGVGQGALDGGLDECATYFTALSPTRNAAHFAATFGLTQNSFIGARMGNLLDLAAWPSADRNLDTGQFLMGPVFEPLYETKVLPVLQQMVASEDFPATVFMSGDGKVTFQDRAHSTPASSGTYGDGASDWHYLLDGSGPELSVTDVRNEFVRQSALGTAQRAVDATSQDTYGEISDSKTGLFNAASADADLATVTTALLARFKDARDRIPPIVILPWTDPGNLFPAVLGAEFNNRYTVRRLNLFQGGGTPFSLDSRLEHVSHRWDAETGWVTEKAFYPT